ATALGGVISVLSTSMPTSPYRGLHVWCWDTEQAAFWNGSAWRYQSYYPLPDPTKTFFNGPNTPAVATANTWSVLSTRVSTTFTAPKAMWVMLSLGAWMRASNPSDIRATLAITGATTGPGTGGVLQEAGGN